MSWFLVTAEWGLLALVAGYIVGAITWPWVRTKIASIFGS